MREVVILECIEVENDQCDCLCWCQHEELELLEELRFSESSAAEISNIKDYSKQAINILRYIWRLQSCFEP